MPSNNRHPSTQRPTLLVSTLLLFALLLSPPPLRATPLAQNSQRERRVNTQGPAVKPTPTPAPKPAGTQTTPARPTPTPTPAASQTPTPTPTHTPTPEPAGPQTLEDLRTRIREVISRPEFAASRLRPEERRGG